MGTKSRGYSNSGRLSEGEYSMLFVPVTALPFFIVVRVPVRTAWIYCLKMSSHQVSSNKPRSFKCRHCCFAFDTHNYCPSCREARKGDDPSVTNEKLCIICSAFCVTSIYAAWHIGIALSSNFVASSSHFVFRTVSQKWLVRFNSNLTCGCN